MIKVKQIIYPTGTSLDASLFPQEDVWSINLIEGLMCHSISISSLPGNRFIIGDNTRESVVIGNSGVFEMNFQSYPISNLQMHFSNNHELLPTIINIIYQEKGEDD